MADVSPVERYQAYLDALDEEADRVQDDEEYLDLLAPGEVIDLLCARDEVGEFELSAEQRATVDRLDALLVQHSRVVTENVEPRPNKPCSQWWWHLHEGPRARERAPAATRAGTPAE